MSITIGCKLEMASFSEAERMGTLQALGNLSSINPGNLVNGVPLPTNYLQSSMQNPSSCNLSAPPPIPPRSDSSRSVDRYNGYSGLNNYYSPYSRFSNGMYSSMGGAYGGMGGAFGGMGGFRSPYSRYGMPHDSYNSFIQLAEESTRPAFESIESVVDIVGSISMMLESTYHAVYGSYNAILGVVDQFSRLKDHLAEVLSFLALIRGLKYMCLKILYLLRLRKDNPNVEAAWNRAQSATGNDFSGFSDDKKSPWPFFMFVGLVIGAPWLMFKLLAKSSAVKKPFDINSWKMPNGHLMGCYAAFDFKSNRRGELSFKTGDTLYIAPNHMQKAPRGWVVACNKKKKIGLIPRNYLRTTAVQPKSGRPCAPAVEVESLPAESMESIPTDLSNGPEPNEDIGSIDNMPDPFTV